MLEFCRKFQTHTMRKTVLRSLLLAAGVLFGSSGFAQTSANQQAGVANTPPTFTYENNNCEDMVNGTDFYYLQTDSLFVSFSTMDGGNNGKHGMHRGAVMDVIHKGVELENVDWTQFLLSTSAHSNWNASSENPNLDTMWTNTAMDTVFAAGNVAQYSDIDWLVSYTTLADTLPILKINVRLINTGTSNFNGYFQYQMDPDGTYQNSYAPGVGQNPGNVTSGWTGNYICAGPTGTTLSSKPTQAIAWLENQPAALMGLSYLYGVWWTADIDAGDTTNISFYHVVNSSTNGNFTTPYECIEMFTDKILDLDTALGSKYSVVTGKVEDVHGVKVKNAIVKVKNINANLIAQTATDTSGLYSVLIPKDVYTFTVSALGYISKSRSIDSSIDSVLNFTVNEGFALTPVDVWAGTGKNMPAGSLSITGEDDIILENNKIAVAISVATNRSQIQFASKGNPLDLIVKDEPIDLIDWIEMNKMTMDVDTTEDWWAKQHVMNDTVYVGSVTATQASVIAEGRFFRELGSTTAGSNEVVETHFGTSLAFRTDIAIKTTYSIEKDDFFFTAKTEITNTAAQPLNLEIGDVMDYDGPGQASFVPGIGSVTGDWGLSKDFTFAPSAPWFAQYGSDLPVLGIIYEGAYADSMQAYGVGRWMSSKNTITVAPSSTYNWTRKVAIKSSLGYTTKGDVIGDVYGDIKQNETGLSYTLIAPTGVSNVGDTITAIVRFVNTNPYSIDSTSIDLVHIPNLALATPTMPYVVNGIPANDTMDVEIKLVALYGGRGINKVLVVDSSANAYESSFAASVIGEGWYAGDNHTHSKYSDGVGTIAENVQAGYNAGLSFMTATDHNTIAQRPDVIAENAKYQDMIIMTGEEVTTSRGHALAYNTGVLIPWSLATYTEQEIIDSVNNTATQYGPGYMYLAHPYYPGLPWRDMSVVNYNGLEVWNGFYHALHSVNTQTFADWDSLNVLGRHIRGISNSDAHNPSIVAKNYIMAYLTEFTEKEIIKVIRDKGWYYGTNGPRLAFEAEGKLMGSSVKVPASGRQVTVNLEVYSNSEQDIDYIRLVKNGIEVQRYTPSSAAQYTDTYTFNAQRGDFIRMEVKAGTGFAYSNPIWFDAGSADAGITQVIINSQLYAPFDTAIHSYRYSIPVSATPTIEVLPSDTNSTVTIDLPLDVNSSTLADRLATITIVSEDKSVTKVYTIEFYNNIGLSEIANGSQTFRLFPVPADDVLNIVTENHKMTHYEIVSVQGQVVMAGEMKDRHMVVNVSELSNGTYIVKVKDANGQGTSQVVVIK